MKDSILTTADHDRAELLKNYLVVCHTSGTRIHRLNLKAGFDNGQIGQLHTATPLPASIRTTVDDIAPFREGLPCKPFSRRSSKRVPAFQKDIPECHPSYNSVVLPSLPKKFSTRTTFHFWRYGSYIVLRQEHLTTKRTFHFDIQHSASTT